MPLLVRPLLLAPLNRSVARGWRLFRRPGASFLIDFLRRRRIDMREIRRDADCQGPRSVCLSINTALRLNVLICRCQPPTAPDRMNAKTRGKMRQNSPPPKNRRAPQLAPSRPREAPPTEPSPPQSLLQHQVRRTPP